LSACGRRAPGNDAIEMSLVAVSQELDPYVGANLETAELSWIYADGLAGSDPTHPEVGSLCIRPPETGASGSPHAASFRYQLRPSVRWHDGKPLVARDIADCFARLRGSAWAHQRPFSLVDRIVVHDDRTFTVELTEADPQFAAAFFSPFGSPGVPIVRRGRLPIGTGPFRAASRTPDAATFSSWAGSPRGNPAAASLRLRYLGSGDTQNLMLSTGETDVALFVPHEYVLLRNIPYFRRRAGVVYVIVNARGVLATPALRSGFAAAIDRDEIARKIYANWSPPYDSVVAPGVGGLPVEMAAAHDPPRARKVLAGLARPIELATYAGSHPIMLLIADSLERIGIRSSIREYAVQEYLAPTGPLRSGKYDAVGFGEYFSLDPDLAATWGCAAIPPQGGNFSRLCDPRLDAAARAGDVRSALEALRKDAVVIPLVQSILCIGLSKRLRGAHEPPDLVPSVYQCAQWSIG
jgi:ABC-type transport system substrate-binding protein